MKSAGCLFVIVLVAMCFIYPWLALLLVAIFAVKLFCK